MILKEFFGAKITIKTLDETLGKYQFLLEENPLTERGSECRIQEVFLEELLCGVIEGAGDLINIKLKCLPLKSETENKN